MWRVLSWVLILLVGVALWQWYGQEIMAQLEGGSCFPAAASGSSSWSVVGAPSISACMIERVLASCHSPAREDGQALYDDGVSFHIDPVFALAFFLHESTCGTAGVARFTHSLGNIVCTPGYQCYGRFRWYPSWEDGFLDWYRLIADEYVARGLVTVDQIVPVYAPASENDVGAYIGAIKRAVTVWRSGQVLVLS